MSDTNRDRDTISIDSSFHQFYKDMTEENNTLDAPFKMMKDIFMLAMCLGMRLGKKKSLDTKKQSIFRWAQFDAQVDVPLLKAVAIADTGDVNILLNRNEILNIAEEYANAGIHELYTYFLNEQGRPLWKLVALLNEHKEE